MFFKRYTKTFWSRLEWPRGSRYKDKAEEKEGVGAKEEKHKNKVEEKEG
jgi:hypothetical protein